MDKERIVVGFTHVDLGWKKSRAEMAELQEKLVVLLVDLCEQNPEMRYLIEQAVHFRDLKRNRPELFEKVKRFVRNGNLEIGCGMASSIETNMTNGECFVRNMQLGTRWFEENMETHPESCEMIDTFGFPPQIPQLIRQMGYRSLFANRLGGNNTEDVFEAVGLDGTVITVCGRMPYSPYCREGHICFSFYMDNSGIDRLFDAAQRNPSSWALVMPYSENEIFPSGYIWKKMQACGSSFRFGSLREVLTLAENMDQPPVHSADLNPEFTGTFSLRHRLKIENRAAENLLLCAEQACAVSGRDELRDELEEAWWKLLYVQFHDILTGSHPTAVYNEAMGMLDEVQTSAREIVRKLVPDKAGNDVCRSYVLLNSLPWRRRERVSIEIPEEWPDCEVISGSVNVSEAYRDDLGVHFLADIRPMCAGTVELRRCGRKALSGESVCCMENRFLKIVLSERYMIEEAVYKPTNRTIMSQVNNLLILQRDCGSFQVEQPEGNEIICGVGSFSVRMERIGRMQIGRIKGAFADADGVPLAYGIELRLEEDVPYVDMDVHVDWRSEQMRLRLCLDTTLSTCVGHYEVPFGVVQRAPYAGRETAKGEWAAHRFVALEDDLSGEGVALINRGCPGVEPGYHRLLSTLLRAPQREVAGMAPDDTSSEHGRHDFSFRLHFYHGGWHESDAASLAQAFNSPLWILPDKACETQPVVCWDNRRIVFSCLKPAGDGYCCLRVYETGGESEQTAIHFQYPVEVYSSDVRERPEKLLCRGAKEVIITVKPFEIVTLLYRRI